MYIDYKALLTGALAFSLSLAWCDGINTTVKALFPSEKKNSTRAALVYALVVTVLIIIIAVAINHMRPATDGVLSAFKSGPYKSPAVGAGSVIHW